MIQKNHPLNLILIKNNIKTIHIKKAQNNKLFNQILIKKIIKTFLFKIMKLNLMIIKLLQITKIQNT